MQRMRYGMLRPCSQHKPMRHLFRYRETVATIVCDEEYLKTAQDAIFKAREIIEAKVLEDGFFRITYDPYPVSQKDDPLVRRMCQASQLSGVGPFAGVAGAVAVHAVEAMRDAGAKEAIVRAHVGIAGIHGDDGLEEDLEVGRGITCGMGGDGGGEMAASREAHDTHIVGVDMPLSGMTAHEFHGLLSIGDGDEAVAMRHAVFEDDEGDALVIEERGPLMTLVIHGEMGIAATRAAHYSAPCSLLLGRQIDGDFRFVGIVGAGHSCPLGP